MNHNIFQKIVDKFKPHIIYLLQYDRQMGFAQMDLPPTFKFPYPLCNFGIYKSKEELFEATVKIKKLHTSPDSLTYMMITVLSEFSKK